MDLMKYLPILVQYFKERPRTNLLKEFEEYVMSTTEPRVLIDSYLIPYTTATVILK